MARVLALPARGDVFADVRDAGRALRLSWHHEDEVVVLSLWRDDTCVGTFRLAAEHVPEVVESLTRGLAEGYRGRSTVRTRVV